MLPGLELATKMVLDLCGGEPSEVTVAGKAEAPERIIDFPLGELRRLAGLEVGLPEIKRVLGHLGFFVAGQGNGVKVAVPSWRSDVEGKADIVEEIVRIVGVDRVPFDAVRPRRGAAQAGAHADPGAHAQGQARARRARPDRGGDLVVHLRSRRPSCSAARRPSLRSPIRSQPTSPTCGRA